MTTFAERRVLLLGASLALVVGCVARDGGRPGQDTDATSGPTGTSRTSGGPSGEADPTHTSGGTAESECSDDPDFVGAWVRVLPALDDPYRGETSGRTVDCVVAAAEPPEDGSALAVLECEDEAGAVSLELSWSLKPEIQVRLATGDEVTLQEVKSNSYIDWSERRTMLTRTRTGELVLGYIDASGWAINSPLLAPLSAELAADSCGTPPGECHSQDCPEEKCRDRALEVRLGSARTVVRPRQQRYVASDGVAYVVHVDHNERAVEKCYPAPEEWFELLYAQVEPPG